MAIHKDAKAMAKALRAALEERHVALSHGECLEIVARQLGFADWNTLSAQQATEQGRAPRSGHPDRAAPVPVPERPQERAAEHVPVIPLRDVVVYPEIVMPIFLGRPSSVRAAELAMHGDKRVILVTQRRPEINDPAAEDLYETGTLAHVLDVTQTPNGSVKALVKGIARAHLRALHAGDPTSASVTLLADVRPEGGMGVDELRKALLARFEQYAKHSGMEAKLAQAGVPLAGVLATFSRMDPATLADALAAQIPLQLAQKQQVLEMLDVHKRCEYLDTLTRELESASPASR
jgi:ATP-dependent Lon protease